MKQILFIGAGGFVGSVLRYGVGVWTDKWLGDFPTGTWLVNLAGSLLIGLLVGFSLRNDQPLYWLLVVGFCGGFTTFSAFALDGIRLLQAGQWSTWLLYALSSVIGGLLMCMAGIWIGQRAA